MAKGIEILRSTQFLFWRRIQGLAAAALVTLALASSGAQAQQFPTGVVHLIVPFAAGGPTDVTARQLAEILRVKWQQPVIIENKPGAGNVIGIQTAVAANPDGQTLIIAPDPSITVDPLVRTKLPYAPERDLTPITTLITFKQVILASTELPVKTLKEAAAYSMTKPLNYGSYGPGTAPHLVLELFKKLSGAKITHVPYGGNAPALLALTRGEVQFSVSGIGSALPFIEGGKFRALAIEGPDRSPILPDVPTFAEAGFPELRAPAWWALFGPANMSEALVAKISQDVAEALHAPAMAAYLAKNGYIVAGDGPESLKVRIRDTRDLWTPLVKSLDLKIN